MENIKDAEQNPNLWGHFLGFLTKLLNIIHRDMGWGKKYILSQFFKMLQRSIYFNEFP